MRTKTDAMGVQVRGRREANNLCSHSELEFYSTRGNWKSANI